MLGCISGHNVIWYLSPTGQYDHIQASRIQQQCGIVMDWVDSMNVPEDKKPSAEEIADKLVERYGYPTDHINEGYIAENDVYNSPYSSDLPLHPLVSTVLCGVKINIYEYDYVSVGQRLYRFT